MSLAVCLLGYSLAVAVLAPDALLRLTRSGRAPRWGVTVWLLALGSVPAVWLVAAGLIGVELVLADGDLGEVLAGCVAALHGAAPTGMPTPRAWSGGWTTPSGPWSSTCRATWRMRSPGGHRRSC